MAEPEKMLQGPIPPILWRLSLPMAVGVVFMILVNLIDTWWASQLGTDELAAMSFSFPVIGVVINVSIGLMIGTSVAVARVVGAGDEAAARRLAAHSLLLGFAIVGVVTLLGLLSQERLFGALGAPPELLPSIAAYMTVWYGSAVLLIVPMMLNGILRARGDAITPRNVMILAALLNAAFDPLFMFGWGPIPGLGLQGAALATAASRLLTFLYALRVAWKLNTLDLHVPTLEELGDSWRTILQVGVPATLTNVLGPVATALVTAIVATHGPTAVAAYGIGARVEALALIPAMALSSALSPFIGQNWGAHLTARVVSAFRTSVAFAVGWGLAACAVLFVAAPAVASLFSPEPGVQEQIALYLRVVPLGFAAYGAMMMTSSAFNAMDAAVRSTMLSALRSLGVAVPVAWLGSELFGLGGAFAGLAVGSWVAGALGLRWMRGFLAPNGFCPVEGRAVNLGAQARFLVEASAPLLQERMQNLIEVMLEHPEVQLRRVRSDAVGFFVGERQLGHIHPSGKLDLHLPPALGDQLVRDGMLEHHRLHDDAGWYTHALEEAGDVGVATWLLQLGYGLVELFSREGLGASPTLDDLGLAPAQQAALQRSVSAFRAAHA